MKFVKLAVATLFAAATAVTAVPFTSDNKFDRFFVIVLENTSYKKTINDPYMGGELRQQGRLLINYRGVTHPSQPNYIAMVAGSTHDINTDIVRTINKPSLADVFAANNITWAAYNENYPENQGCFTKSKSEDKLYRRKHNPFISFKSVNSDPEVCIKHIKSSNMLYKDMLEETVPQYVFYTPNMYNDGHDTSLAYASRWLKGFISPLLQNKYFNRTLFVVTFDEDDYSTLSNRVFTLLLGSGVTAGSTDDTAYTHYSQLATVQARWGLPWLTENDRDATPFRLA